MFLIQYGDDKETGYGITNDLKTKYFIRHDAKKNKLIKEEFDSYLKGKSISIYKISDLCLGRWKVLLNYVINKPVNPKILLSDHDVMNLYEYFSDKKELKADQIAYDKLFSYINTDWLDLIYNSVLLDRKVSAIPYLNEGYNGGSILSHVTIPDGVQDFVKSSLLSNELLVCEDHKGLYLVDEANNLVTRHLTPEEAEVIKDAIH